MNSLQGKVALVTGASRGIGQGIALSLAKAGADIALADIGLDVLEETKVLIEKEGVKVKTYQVDVTNYDTVKTMVQAVAADFGTLDVAVNNAGVLGIHKVIDMTGEDWDRIMNVNAKGVFLCSKAELEVMLPNKSGSIINISSILGKTGMSDVSAYSASKFAVVGFTNSLAKEVAKEGITVNALCPGIVGTGMWRGDKGLAKAFAKDGETEEQSWERNQESLLPQGEAQTPEDMGQLAVYLASAVHVTGQAISVDGGFGM
ncbi:SDR family NAD(P)-dependent oxidoreductase [Pedobacter metabolipauper]|uniref:Meso-butanediol dehydrogenase/(S,S)-butanediol dehydrogenase/diacetyl reductase n=1 Tax=Pedobacter metabolipauper TaxID=425513 RepID=A0A4R6SQA6_9SPHI|nr:SDR family NAD(P)-dependent oxidoreductase [Pedobacter metabolipauper]TDQ06309.1 meso-butanediol dehydrogenase/(S,S)-butanediol dehydrogenase/diacetyl reductase [Pedobacter metabolipauper]